MSNKAKNSKESILCDAKELMKLYDRVTWHLPKARREHNAVRKFEDAGYAIIHDCTIAMELKGEDEQQRKDIDAMVDIFNSYSGLLKNRTDYKRLLELRDKLSPDWWQWLEWDDRRKCITYKQGYSPNERLNQKYNLKLAA